MHLFNGSVMYDIMVQKTITYNSFFYWCEKFCRPDELDAAWEAQHTPPDGVGCRLDTAVARAVASLCSPTNFSTSLRSCRRLRARPKQAVMKRVSNVSGTLLRP